MRIRRKGYQVIYEPSAIFFEFTPKEFSARLAQKTRRAQGIIQQLLRFSGMIFRRTYGLFAFLIFPFEFFFHVVSPLLFIALLILFMLNIPQVSFMITISTMFLIFLGISGTLLLLKHLNKRKVNLFSIALTFFESQVYLFLGLLPLLTGRTSHKWKIIGEVIDQNTIRIRLAQNEEGDYTSDTIWIAIHNPIVLPDRISSEKLDKLEDEQWSN
jgi:cellulose synthase/poly-beta-1,6-N-acetylglucosamine synthase-like glycosyltransferase